MHSSGSGHRREVSPSPRLGRLPKSRCSRVWRGEAERPPLATRSGRRPRMPAGKRGPREQPGARRQGPAGTGPDQVARAACGGQVREGGGDGRAWPTRAGGGRPGRARGSGRRSHRPDEPSASAHTPPARTASRAPAGLVLRLRATETRAGRWSERRELLSRELWGPHTGEPHSGSWLGSPQLEDSLWHKAPRCIPGKSELIAYCRRLWSFLNSQNQDCEMVAGQGPATPKSSSDYGRV